MLAGRPRELADARAALARAESALERGDDRGFASARAGVWTAIVRASYLQADGRGRAR